MIFEILLYLSNVIIIYTRVFTVMRNKNNFKWFEEINNVLDRGFEIVRVCSICKLLYCLIERLNFIGITHD